MDKDKIIEEFEKEAQIEKWFHFIFETLNRLVELEEKGTPKDVLGSEFQLVMKAVRALIDLGVPPPPPLMRILEKLEAGFGHKRTGGM